jgi:hypothetical protein
MFARCTLIHVSEIMDEQTRGNKSIECLSVMQARQVGRALSSLAGSLFYFLFAISFHLFRFVFLKGISMEYDIRGLFWASQIMIFLFNGLI